MLNNCTLCTILSVAFQLSTLCYLFKWKKQNLWNFTTCSWFVFYLVVGNSIGKMRGETQFPKIKIQLSDSSAPALPVHLLLPDDGRVERASTSPEPIDISIGICTCRQSGKWSHPWVIHNKQTTMNDDECLQRLISKFSVYHVTKTFGSYFAAMAPMWLMIGLFIFIFHIITLGFLVRAQFENAAFCMYTATSWKPVL